MAAAAAVAQQCAALLPRRVRRRPTARRPRRRPAISLIWPADGTVIRRFDGDNSKGIDISAAPGTPVVAAAPGTVVYAGNGLRGYGNLLILKHNGEYLTAYAHNRALLVKEGESVNARRENRRNGRHGHRPRHAALRTALPGPLDRPVAGLPPR